MDKEVIELMHKILDLSLNTKNITVAYYEKVGLFEVYKIENGEYAYQKNVYLTGILYEEKQVIEDLKQMIKDIENMNK